MPIQNSPRETWHNGVGEAYSKSETPIFYPLHSSAGSVMDNMDYDPFGPLANWELGNSAVMQRDYNADGQLESYTLGTSTLSLDYSLAGLITSITSTSAPTQQYQYDALSRLTHVNSATPTYQYDALGNRISYTTATETITSLPSPTGNQLESVGGQPYSYDAAGNITHNGTHTFDYNRAGRLEVINLGTNQQLNYLINAQGQRVGKIGSQPPAPGDANVDGQINRYDVKTVINHMMGRIPSQESYDCIINDPTGPLEINGQDVVCINNLIASGTTDASASAQVYYSYDDQNRLIGEYSQTGQALSEILWLGNMPVGVIKNNKLYFIQSDHLNTPRLITNNTNQTLWEWPIQGSPFGDTSANTDPDGNGEHFQFNLRFPGQYYDTESGLHYN